MARSISIPKYSLSEELISAISHGIGALLAIAGCVLGIVRAAGDVRIIGAIGVVSAAVYGFTMIELFTMSALYHALPVSTAKRILRVIDHCSVFLLIAGTYTPYALVSLRGARGWSIFGIIWGLTVIGCVFNAFDVDRYQVVSGIINVLMGWMVVLSAKYLTVSIGHTGMFLLIAGGISYSVGAILYAVGHKVKYAHSIFHFFVLGGGILHFLSIYLTVL